LTPKSSSGPPGLWLADRMMPPSVWCLRIRLEAAGVDRIASCPDDHLGRAVGGGHAQDHLRGAVVEIAPVAAQHEGLARRAADRVEDRLHEVLEIMWLHEDRGLLAQAAGAGLLALDRPGFDHMNGHRHCSFQAGVRA
jgi:hypothetical protein